MTAEPRTIARIRERASSATESILLQHIDSLAERLQRFDNLDLTDAEILAVAGPATDSIGDKDCWLLGRRDLTRLARAILAAAMKSRAG